MSTRLLPLAMLTVSFLSAIQCRAGEFLQAKSYPGGNGTLAMATADFNGESGGSYRDIACENLSLKLHARNEHGGAGTSIPIHDGAGYRIDATHRQGEVIPPNSLYCCHKSVSRISAAARNLRMSTPCTAKRHLFRCQAAK